MQSRISWIVLVPSKLHLTKNNTQCIKTVFTVPIIQSFKFYSQSFLLLFIFLCVTKIWLIKAELWKLESIHGIFDLFHNFSHKAILISAHSTEDEQIIIWGSKCFQWCLICQIQGLRHGSWMREIWRYWAVTVVPAKKADGKLNSCSSCSDEQR